MMSGGEVSPMATANVAFPNTAQLTEPWLVTEQKVRAAVERIVSSARPQKVIVFGSYARGQAKPGSDLDVLVIVDDTLANCRAESVKLRRALRGISMPMDIIVTRRVDMERLRHSPGLLYETALSEGRVMYERA
jgi:predicted nucleotidyltransferase